MSNSDSQADRKTAARVVSVAVAVGFVLYWIVQIQDVRELLAMAYG